MTLVRHQLLLAACGLAVLLVGSAGAFPDQGKWRFEMNQDVSEVTVPKSMYAGSKIYVQIVCESNEGELLIHWKLSQSVCWTSHERFDEKTNSNNSIISPTVTSPCRKDIHIVINELKIAEDPKPTEPSAEAAIPQAPDAGAFDLSLKVGPPVFTITKDGDYHFALIIQEKNQQNFVANVYIEMRDANGYLSAVDYPLLIFYGSMCIVYLIFGTIWLLVSFMQWRDLLRIQFWIGGVILLGMLEKAMFYAEFHAINTSGNSVDGVVLMAEWVSCAKRTLARMLVVIVSLGFGIVKPRLGPMLHRVVGTGGLYFVLACVESYLRLKNTQNDPSNQILVASIPLAVLDSAICWWIFTSLVQTTRTLRLRRNLVKLALYRHFTNTLIFGVLASVVFMLYSIKAHKSADCLKDWKALWQDEAFWHILFSSLLLVIMILWRPTNNNQRYAFTPLLDNPEDEDDDEEEDQFVSDAYGVKLRGQSRTSLLPKQPTKTTTNEEDDLRWVEENIPQAIADVVLPVLDSDEEIISTKFEVSKMQ